MKPKGQKSILALASGGGHWEQLMLLRPAWEHHRVHYATTLPGLGDKAGVEATLVPDCNRNEKIAIVRSAVAIFLLLVRLRPDLVVTTGALPGLLALVIARRLGAKTIWIDSVANAEEMSMAGRTALRHAHHCLSQWPHVAEIEGARYEGSVL